MRAGETNPSAEFKEPLSSPERRVVEELVSHTYAAATLEGTDRSHAVSTEHDFTAEELTGWAARLDTPLHRLQDEAPQLFTPYSDILICHRGAHKEGGRILAAVDCISLDKTYRNNTHSLSLLPDPFAGVLSGMAQLRPAALGVWRERVAEHFGLSAAGLRPRPDSSLSGVTVVQDYQEWVRFMKGIRDSEHGSISEWRLWPWSDSTTQVPYHGKAPLNIHEGDKGYDDERAYLTLLAKYDITQSMSPDSIRVVSDLMARDVSGISYFGKCTDGTKLSNGRLEVPGRNDPVRYPTGRDGRPFKYHPMSTPGMRQCKDFPLNGAVLEGAYQSRLLTAQDTHILGFDATLRQLLYMVCDSRSNDYRGRTWQLISFQFRDRDSVPKIVEATYRNPDAFRLALYVGARGLFKPVRDNQDTGRYRPGVQADASDTVMLFNLQPWERARQQFRPGNSNVLNMDSGGLAAWRASLLGGQSVSYPEPQRGLVT